MLLFFFLRSFVFLATAAIFGCYNGFADADSIECKNVLPFGYQDNGCPADEPLCVGSDGSMLAADVVGDLCAVCMNSHQADWVPDFGCSVDTPQCVQEDGITNPPLSKAGSLCVPAQVETTAICINDALKGNTDTGCEDDDSSKPICVGGDGSILAADVNGDMCAVCVNSNIGHQVDDGCTQEKPNCVLADSTSPPIYKAGEVCVEEPLSLQTTTTSIACDDFNRDDGNLGDGWTNTTYTDPFEIVNGAVVSALPTGIFPTTFNMEIYNVAPVEPADRKVSVDMQIDGIDTFVVGLFMGPVDDGETSTGVKNYLRFDLYPDATVFGFPLLTVATEQIVVLDSQFLPADIFTDDMVGSAFTMEGAVDPTGVITIKFTGTNGQDYTAFAGSYPYDLEEMGGESGMQAVTNHLTGAGVTFDNFGNSACVKCFNNRAHAHQDHGCTADKPMCMSVEGHQLASWVEGQRCFKCRNSSNADQIRTDLGCEHDTPRCVLSDSVTEPDVNKGGDVCIAVEE